MRTTWLLAALLGMTPLALTPLAARADTNVHQPSQTDPKKSPSVSAPVSQVTNKPPLEIVEKAPVGTVHNPYTGKPDMIAEGKKVFFGVPANYEAALARHQGDLFLAPVQRARPDPPDVRHQRVRHPDGRGPASSASSSKSLSSDSRSAMRPPRIRMSPPIARCIGRTGTARLIALRPHHPYCCSRTTPTSCRRRRPSGGIRIRDNERDQLQARWRQHALHGAGYVIRSNICLTNA